MTLFIKPKASLFLTLLLVLILVAAVGTLVLLSLSVLVTSALLAICLLYFIFLIKKHILFQHPQSITACWPEDEKNWQIQLANTTVHNAILQRDSLLTQHLLVLNFKLRRDLRIYSLVLFPDSISADLQRHLRQRLLH